MKKGITPIISIIVLLLITVSLASAAWSFLYGFIIPPISKTFLIPSGGSYCVDGFIKIHVLNTGYQSDLLPDDFIMAAIDGTNLVLPDDLELFGSIATGKSARVLDYDCNTKPACSTPISGYHIVDLGTNSQIDHISVYCP